MTTFVALLRAVNLGSHKKVAMADLRRLATSLGLEQAETLLQSGNLVFRSRIRSAGALERTLEAAAAEHLSLETEIYVRSRTEWTEVVAGNPYPAVARDDPGHLLVMMVRDAVPAGRLAALRSAIVDRETVEARGRTLYFTFPDGVGRSRLTPALITRHLGQPGTARNWNTVLRIASACARLDNG